jgi:hypothetical protein
MGTTRLDAEVSRPTTGRSPHNTKDPLAAILAQGLPLATLTRTEPVGPPASTRRGSARPDKVVLPTKCSRRDDPLTGPGATSECQNSCTAGPSKHYNFTVTRST